MDAMPIEMSQELSGWSTQLGDQYNQIKLAAEGLKSLPQGGTAIGTGINAPKNFGNIFANEVSKLT